MVVHWLSTGCPRSSCQGVSSDCFDSNCEIDPAVVLTRCAAHDGHEGHEDARENGNRWKPTETEKLVNCLQCRLCSFPISERCSKSETSEKSEDSIKSATDQISKLEAKLT